MQTKWMQTAFLLIGMASLASVAAHAQTDVAASLYGAFNGTSNGNGVTQSPSNAAGGLIELRHIRNPIIGYEATYSFNRANQTYTGCSTITSLCTRSSVSANAHEVTGDWVVSVKLSNLKPFALAGGGLLFDAPVGGQTSASSTVKPLFVYGGGVDWGLLPHIGLRLQYRGNLYKAPNLTKLFTSTDTFTHTAEPMIGVYFRL
jgi:opacity protein-like surface antigen